MLYRAYRCHLPISLLPFELYCRVEELIVAHFTTHPFVQRMHNQLKIMAVKIKPRHRPNSEAGSIPDSRKGERVLSDSNGQAPVQPNIRREN
jgi:hypothetical protein